MDWFVSKSLRDKLSDKFLCRDQGTMTVFQCEARFQELSRYATSIVPTKEERISYVVQGLRPKLKIETHSLGIWGRCYLDIINHTYSIEKFSCKAQRESHKHVYHQVTRDLDFLKD